MKFILNLKKLRQKKGITQKQLAELINVRQATISDIENNKHIPLLETLLLIALELNITLDELITFEKAHEEYTDELLTLSKKEPK